MFRQTCPSALSRLLCLHTLSIKLYHLPPLIPLSRVANLRSVHTLASVHVHWGATSLPCLARGTPGRFNCLGVSFTPSLSCPPWLHGRYPLPRYYGDSDSCSARSGTEQVSLVHTLELLDIPSPTTPCAPVCRHCFGSGRLGQRFALGAIVSSSDFAHHMQAHQSHQAESSLCRRLRLQIARACARHAQLRPAVPQGG